MIEFDVDMGYLLEYGELDCVVLNDENGEHEPMEFVPKAGSGTITAEQVSMYLKAMAYDLQTPSPFKTLDERQAIIEKYANEIAELGSGTCNPVETETLENVTARVMECDECGGTYEHVNGDYERCPHCGKVVER